jgi:hypothetical protein
VFGHMVERRCNACATAWLLTSQQARFSRRPSRRAKVPGAMGTPANEESVLGLQASGSQMTFDTDELLAR